MPRVRKTSGAKSPAPKLPGDPKETVDLRKGWPAFVIFADAPPEKFKDAVRTCVLADEDEAFPFVAMPLAKKPTFDRAKAITGIRTIERVNVKNYLAKSGFKWGWVDEEGLLNKSPFNPDATAFLAGSGICGPAVFVRR